MPLGCTPIEVESVLALAPDYDLVVRCLEYIRVHIGAIVPGCGDLPVRLLALSHHHPGNCYPALAIEGDANLSFDEMGNIGPCIDAWVAATTLPVLASLAQSVAAPTWAALCESADESRAATDAG